MTGLQRSYDENQNRTQRKTKNIRVVLAGGRGKWEVTVDGQTIPREPGAGLLVVGSPSRSTIISGPSGLAPWSARATQLGR